MYTLVDFTRVMQAKNLLDRGEHVVISVENEEVYDPNIHLQYCRTLVDLTSRKPLKTTACRNVLVLAPSPPTNPDYGDFKREVVERSGAEPFNIPVHKWIKIDVREVEPVLKPS